MKVMIRTALVGASLALATLPALADDDDSKAEKNPDDPTYSSFRLTQATADFDNLDPGFNLGYTLGFRLPTIEFLSVELDISSTIIPGENSGGVSEPIVNNDNGGILDPILGGGGDGGGDSSSSTGKNTRSNNELLLNTVGIFGRLETPRSLSDRFFGSVRFGYEYVDSNIPELVEDGRGGSAWGVGLGYRYGKDGRVELRFTQVAADLRYLGLGVSF